MLRNGPMCTTNLYSTLVTIWMKIYPIFFLLKCKTTCYPYLQFFKLFLWLCAIRSKGEGVMFVVDK